MSQARTRPWIALGAIAVAGAIVAYLSLGASATTLSTFGMFPSCLIKNKMQLVRQSGSVELFERAQ